MAKEKDPSRAIPPPQMADMPPPTYTSPNDYSSLEIMMAMQGTLGKLTEAVESLKERSKSHGDELKQIGKDVHAAKVVIAVVGGLILLAAGFISWLVNTYISTHPGK